MSKNTSFRSFILPTLLLFFGGWGGVAAIIYFTEPLIWMRWALFALLFLALTGTAIPIVYFFHLRFPSDAPVGPRVILRQAQWVGVYGLVLLWLRWGDLLTLWLTLGFAGGLLAIEWLIRLRERSRWSPPESDDESA
ncbi:MAG: hypothetical protein PVJ21_18485 [Anaerolineales bacterium]|jgi:hypothetical protein